MAKSNNNRKYPYGTSPRPDLSKVKREEAVARKVEYDKLSVEQKLKRLDDMFGVGKGATNQRKRYAALKNPSMPMGVHLDAADIAAINEMNSVDDGKKRIKAKDRRKMEKKEE